MCSCGRREFNFNEIKALERLHNRQLDITCLLNPQTVRTGSPVVINFNEIKKLIHPTSFLSLPYDNVAIEMLIKVEDNILGFTLGEFNLIEITYSANAMVMTF